MTAAASSSITSTTGAISCVNIFVLSFFIVQQLLTQFVDNAIVGLRKHICCLRRRAIKANIVGLLLPVAQTCLRGPLKFRLCRVFRHIKTLIVGGSALAGHLQELRRLTRSKGELPFIVAAEYLNLLKGMF